MKRNIRFKKDSTSVLRTVLQEGITVTETDRKREVKDLYDDRDGNFKGKKRKATR